MFIDSAVLDVFGSRWGVLEFITLLAIVAGVSYVGIRVLRSNFTRNKVTGKIKTPLGGDGKKLFKTVMGAIDLAATENDEKIDTMEKRVSLLLFQW